MAETAWLLLATCTTLATNHRQALRTPFPIAVPGEARQQHLLPKYISVTNSEFIFENAEDIMKTVIAWPATLVETILRPLATSNHLGSSVTMWACRRSDLGLRVSQSLKTMVALWGTVLQVCYPKQTKKPLYEGLVTQLKSLYIPFVEAEQLQQQPLRESYDVVLDAMFGFSFKGEPRPPFDTLIQVSASICHMHLAVASDASLQWSAPVEHLVMCWVQAGSSLWLLWYSAGASLMHLRALKCCVMYCKQTCVHKGPISSITLREPAALYVAVMSMHACLL